MKAKTAWMALSAAVVAFGGAGEARALTQRVNGIPWEYHVSNGQAAIFTGGRSPAIPSTTAGAITVPATLGGYPVKRIGNAAFYGCDKLTSVTIPNGVTSIGEDAFCACRKMTRVTIPASVTRIEREAFWNCEALPSVEIPAGVKSIADCAFHNCNSLKSLTVPNGVTNIGAYAFRDCHGLTTVSIPPSVKSIGEGAFWECDSLESLAIPNGATNIEEWVFCDCRALKSVSIPPSVKGIGAYAFYGCRGLMSVTIPHTVTCVERWAFEGCSALESVTIHGNAMDIEQGAFSGCNGLETVYAPASWEGTGKLNGLPGGCEVVYKPSKAVEFNGAGGICSGRWLTVLEGCEYGGLPTAARPGWAFQGWWTGPNGTGFRVLPGSRVQGGHRTLHAFWVKPTYTVAFSGMGGTGTMAAQTLKYGTASLLPWNRFTRAGYQFLGWSRSKWGEVEFANRASVKNLSATGGEVRLYARWAKTAYTVAFNGMGGTGTMSPQPMRYGTASLLKWNAFKREGFAFAGWATRPWGEVVYANRASVKNLSQNGAMVKLYAVWRATGAAAKAKSAKSARAARAARAAVAATTSDGSDGSAVADGDGGTAWVVDAEGGAWVVLSFTEAREVASVEVAGENLPAGMRVLLSEDAEEWVEGEEGTARYVWVAFPEGSGTVRVGEIGVLPE